MDPEEIEFLGEKEMISIIPTFNYGVMHLISGDIGPFKAGLPIRVPLWVALNFKQQHTCKIQQPDWMEIEILEEIKNNEKTSSNFTKMPSEHYMTMAKLLLGCASDDLIQANDIRTLVKDIWDIRMMKIRNSVDAVVQKEASYAAVDNLTMMEINSVRPLLPSALTELYQMRKVQKSRIGTNTTLGQSSRMSLSFSRS